MIRQGIRAFLLKDTDLEAIVHGHIHADFAPGELPDVAHITMVRTSTIFWRSVNYGDTENDVVRIQLDCWGRTRAEAVTMAKLVRNSYGGDSTGRKLRNFNGTMAYSGGTFHVQSCSFEEESDDFDVAEYADEVGIPRVTQTLNVAYDE